MLYYYYTRPVLLSSCDSVLCCDIEGNVVVAGFPHCVRVWGSVEQGDMFREYQVGHTIQVKIVGDTIYMLGKDSKVRVLHMVLGRVVKEVIVTSVVMCGDIYL